MANNEYKLDFSGGRILLTSGGTTKELLSSENVVQLGATVTGAIPTCSEQDLNSLTTTGFYSGQSLTNTPPQIGNSPTGWLFIQVINHRDPAGYVKQIAYGLVSPWQDAIWVRTQVNGAWGGWGMSYRGRARSLSTSSTYQGQWFRFAQIRLFDQYANISAQFAGQNEGHGSMNGRYWRLRVRVKQQQAMGSAPYIVCALDDSSSKVVNPRDFGYTVTANDANETKVDFYHHINTGYCSAYIDVEKMDGASNDHYLKLFDGEPYTTTAPSVLANWGGYDWNTVSFQNGWTQYSGTDFQDVGYKRDIGGVVRLRGLITPGTWSSTMFALPSGLRPKKNLIFPAACADGFAEVRVNSSGNVVGSGSGTWLSLDSIQFEAEQ